MWRLADFASRDQDRVVPRRGRFDERVRRSWFQVSQDDIDRATDLDDLASTIAQRSGEDQVDVRARLAWYASLEDEGARPREDPMLRPGAPSDAPPPRIRRP